MTEKFIKDFDEKYFEFGLVGQAGTVVFFHKKQSQ
jgi:hypothetical protein